MVRGSGAGARNRGQNRLTVRAGPGGPSAAASWRRAPAAGTPGRTGAAPGCRPRRARPARSSSRTGARPPRAAARPPRAWSAARGPACAAPWRPPRRVRLDGADQVIVVRLAVELEQLRLDVVQEPGDEDEPDPRRVSAHNRPSAASRAGWRRANSILRPRRPRHPGGSCISQREPVRVEAVYGAICRT